MGQLLLSSELKLNYVSKFKRHFLFKHILFFNYLYCSRADFLKMSISYKCAFLNDFFVEKL
jgi:hypothetical protein